MGGTCLVSRQLFTYNAAYFSLGNKHHRRRTMERQAVRQKTYHLIFATDGKGTTRLAHVYAESSEQASQAAIAWRDETHPNLRILRVRAEPNSNT